MDRHTAAAGVSGVTLALNIPGAWIDAPRRFEWERDPHRRETVVGLGVGPFEGYRATVRRHPMSQARQWSVVVAGVSVASGTTWFDEMGEQPMFEAEYYAWRHRNGLDTRLDTRPALAPRW